MSKKAGLYLLTGFLGSGKTTLLTGLMENLKNEKIGIIQNEFGRISIDGEIVKKEGLELIEINRGSIFCSCLQMKFAEAMLEMADKELEYLFVESSGLADPSNIQEVLEAIKIHKGDYYEYKGAICLIDGLHFLEQIEDLETVNRQLKHCHVAVINKTDLIDGETLGKIRERIAMINDKAKVVETTFGSLPKDILEEDLLKYSWAESEDTTNSPENKPKTLVMTSNASTTREKISAFIDSISKDTYRIKGFFQLEDGWNQIDVVNKKIDIKKCDREEGESQIVFISKVGPNIIKPIIDNWKQIVGVEMQLKN